MIIDERYINFLINQREYFVWYNEALIVKPCRKISVEKKQYVKVTKKQLMPSKPKNPTYVKKITKKDEDEIKNLFIKIMERSKKLLNDDANKQLLSDRLNYDRIKKNGSTVALDQTVIERKQWYCHFYDAKGYEQKYIKDEIIQRLVKKGLMRLINNGNSAIIEKQQSKPMEEAKENEPIILKKKKKYSESNTPRERHALDDLLDLKCQKCKKLYQTTYKDLISNKNICSSCLNLKQKG